MSTTARAVRPQRAARPVPAIETVTPDIAAKWLRRNTHNRSLRMGLVESFALDMSAGNWMNNGEAIKFAEGGVLIDGQHRLAAIIKSGVTLDLLVIRDLPMIAQETLDAGAKRSFADVLRLRNEQNYATLATACRAAYGWEHGHRYTIRDGIKVVSNAALIDVLERNPDLREVCAPAERIRRNISMPTSVGALSTWLFRRLDKDDAEWFIDRLCSATDQRENDPIFALRKQVMSSFAERTGNRHPGYILALTIKAWNKYRDGQDASFLRFKPGGSRPDAFPEPH